jgi:hypothetical protein
MAGLKDMGLQPIGTDGLEEHLWDLLDYDDFLVHVFYHPVRKHYDLESMWRDAPRAELGLPAEVMDTSVLEGLAPPVDMPPFRGSFGAFPGELDDEAAAAGAPGELALDDEGEDLDEGEYDASDEGEAGEADEDAEGDEFDDGDYGYGDEDEANDDELAADDDLDAGEPAPASAPAAAQRRK